ncbi:MAG: DUF2162 domain-containing protein [Bacillota bacterium]
MLLWHAGLVTATLVLSLKTGLLLGTSWFSTRFLMLFSAVLASAVLVLAAALGSYQQVLVQWLDDYTFAGTVLMALALIYLGLQQPGWESSAGRQKNPSWRAYFFGLLPCPFCLLALGLSVTLLAPLAGVSTLLLGRNVAALFGLMVLGVSLGVRRLARLTAYDPHRLFNQVLLLTGVGTLVLAFTIPNIVQAMQTPFRPVTIESPHWFGFTAAGLLGVTLWGYFCRTNQLRSKNQNEVR